MAVNIPDFDSVVQGLGYANVPTPDSDAADSAGYGGDLNNGAPATQAAPLQSMSLATKTEDAPRNAIPGKWNDAVHRKDSNWMEGDTYEPEPN